MAVLLPSCSRWFPACPECLLLFAFFLPWDDSEILGRVLQEPSSAVCCRKNEISKVKVFSCFPNQKSSLCEKGSGNSATLGFVNPPTANGLAISWPGRFEVWWTVKNVTWWCYRLLKIVKELKAKMSSSQGHSSSHCQNVSNNQTYLSDPNLRLLHTLGRVAPQSSRDHTSDVEAMTYGTCPEIKPWQSRTKKTTEPFRTSEPIHRNYRSSTRSS